MGKGQHNHKCYDWVGMFRSMLLTIRTVPHQTPGPTRDSTVRVQAPRPRRVIATNFQHKDPRQLQRRAISRCRRCTAHLFPPKRAWGRGYLRVRINTKIALPFFPFRCWRETAKKASVGIIKIRHGSCHTLLGRTTADSQTDDRYANHKASTLRSEQ